MRTETVGPVGVRIEGLDLTEADPSDLALLPGLLAEHGVMVLPDQSIDDAGFVEFLAGFGELVFTTGETPVPGYADLNVISNVGRTSPPRSNFHVDTSYVSRPPAYTALRAVTIPTSGGETLFSNQYRAYETLSDDLRDHLDGRTIEHVVTGVEPAPGEERSARHPVFRPHPLSGRTALYLTAPARCASISGLDADETAAMVTTLLEHSTAEDNLYRHAWSPGDVVMWDNGCVLHRADHSGVEGDRVMHRGMSRGYAVP